MHSRNGRTPMMRSCPNYESWEINCRKQAMVIFPMLPEPSDRAARSAAEDKRACTQM